MVEPDVELFRAYGSELAGAVESALPGWVRSAVERFVPPNDPDVEDPERLHADIDAAAAAAVADIGGRLRDLLARDVDDQWTNPLSVMRRSVDYPTKVLEAWSVEPVDRDRHAQRLHPDDVYDLTPGSFADFGPDVHDRGIKWGAAKAHLHLRRRRQI